jgi:hypothetical protein
MCRFPRSEVHATLHNAGPRATKSLKSLSSEQKSKETMRFDGFRYGSRIDIVPSETPERYRLTQNQQSPQERYETSNRRRSAANTQVDRTICSQKCKLLRATSCTAYGPPLASALAHALRSPLFRARLSHTNCSHGGSERSSSSALAICLYRFRVTSKNCATGPTAGSPTIKMCSEFRSRSWRCRAPHRWRSRK